MTSTPSKSHALYQLIRTIRPAHRRLARAVGALLEDTDLNIGLRAVMEVLDKHGPKTVPDVARIQFLARQQVQLLMNDLLAGGYVEKRPNPAHKRSHLFALTSKGEAAFAALRSREDETLEELGSELSLDEIRTAEKVMQRLVTHYAAHEDDPDNPSPLA